MRLSILLHLLFNFISIVYQIDAFSMTLHPIDSPHLQILPKNMTMQERHEIFINISRARSHHYNRGDNNASKIGINSIESHLHRPMLSGYFLTQLYFGERKPPFDPYVIVDLRSDETWIQCSDCHPCFILQKKFNVDSSPTYNRMTFDDQRCDTKLRFQGNCGFEWGHKPFKYVGYLGTDTFIFKDTNKKDIYFPNTAFGCAVRNPVMFKERHISDVGKVAGVLGLSPGTTRSFITQLDTEIHGRFSICIPKSEGDTVISFGDDAKIGKDAKKIAMYTKGVYHLYLVTFSVLHVPIGNPFYFSLDKKNHKRGFFVDPSSPTTQLNIMPFTALAAGVAVWFAQYEWIPIVTFPKTKLCYIEEPDGIEQHYPAISFSFKKARKGLAITYITFPDEIAFRKNSPLPGFCLNFEVTTGPSVLGAAQMAGKKWLFDVKGESLEFEDC
ncbi:hypothetical protein RND81_04G199100 [Saponaria officinalis]|uniref:Peptidase A1 domain-containing protein n=1 Tax=Saponaria officinalis TaxID=3572 RepID=A0AAW1LFQ0_SAPOF